MPTLIDPKTGRVQQAYVALRRKGLYANVLNAAPSTQADSQKPSRVQGQGISGPLLGGKGNPSGVLVKAKGRF